MDESGERGLEEERRLAYVGITRAREEARISFAANRQVYGRWNQPKAAASRFVDELAHGQRRGELSRPAITAVDPVCARRRRDGTTSTTDSGYDSPGWKRAQSKGYAGGSARPHQGHRRARAELVAVSDPAVGSVYSRGGTGCSIRSSAAAR